MNGACWSHHEAFKTNAFAWAALLVPRAGEFMECEDEDGNEFHASVKNCPHCKSTLCVKVPA